MIRKIGALVSMIALVVLGGCQQAPATITVSRTDFNQAWQSYLPTLRGGKLHVGVATSLVDGNTRTEGFYDVIDVAKFGITFVEAGGYLLSIASYRIDLSGTFLSDMHRTQHVSGMYLSIGDDSMQQSLPFSVAVNAPRLGFVTLEHNYSIERSSIVFTIHTNAFPTGG